MILISMLFFANYILEILFNISKFTLQSTLIFTVSNGILVTTPKKIFRPTFGLHSFKQINLTSCIFVNQFLTFCICLIVFFKMCLIQIA